MEHRITVTTATGRQGEVYTHQDVVNFPNKPTKKEIARLAKDMQLKYIDIKGDGDVVEKSTINSVSSYYIYKDSEYVKMYENKTASEYEMYEDGIFNYDAVSNESANTNYTTLNGFKRQYFEEQA